MNSNYRKHNFYKQWWRDVDQQLIIALIILYCISIILVTTSGPMVAARIGLDESYFVFRQPIYILISMICIIAVSSLNKIQIKRLAILGFLMNILLLILVKFYGYTVKGAVRWISIGGISIQPSEFIKPFFEIVVGWLLSMKFDHAFPGFSVSIFLYIIISTLLMLQPDFGMFIMLTTVFGVQLFVAGISMFWIISTCIIATFVAISAYFFLPHVATRINNFLSPANAENYQITKSITAFERGGIYGCGPGEGSIKQSLPDSHTDFIFAVAGEEFGAILCLLIICIFAFIVVRSSCKLIHINDKFSKLAATGIVVQFGLQSIINIGVTVNLLPTKGMTLPFISYGGSSTIAMSIAFGMMLGLTKDSVLKT